MAANPWSTTPHDIALAPFYKTLRSLQPVDKELTPKKTSLTTPVKEVDESLKDKEGKLLASTTSSATEEDNTPSYKSTLISKLRKADKLNQERRKDPFLSGIGFENKKLLIFSRKLINIFLTLSKYLEQFQHADILKTAYIQAFISNQILWDDMSQENKNKLILCIQQAGEAILTLLANKRDTLQAKATSTSTTTTTAAAAHSLAVDVETYTKIHADLSRLMTRIAILPPPPDTAAYGNYAAFLEISHIEYSLEDLFELLMEYSAALEVIRITSSSQYKLLEAGTLAVDALLQKQQQAQQEQVLLQGTTVQQTDSSS